MKVFKSPIFQKKAEKNFNKKELIELEKFISKLKKNIILGKPISYEYYRKKRLVKKEYIF